MQRLRVVRELTIIGALAAMAGCSSTTAPLHDNLEHARTRWFALNPSDYRFEVSVRSSWFPASQFYRVTVVNRAVVEVTDTTGTPVVWSRMTIDSLWTRILDARDRGDLNSALFNVIGVPVETDIGPWPVDGGVHYSVRNFRQSR